MEHTIERIPVATLVSGRELALTIHTFRGGPGPRVGVSAAIHGDETVGVEVLRRLAGMLADVGDELRGTIRLLPVGNPLAYETNSRNTVLDQTNLNRVFPGDPDGWLTEQLAAKITEHYLVDLDAYVDLHAGGAYPVVDYVYLTNAPDLSRAFGCRLLYRPATRYPGTTGGVAEERGIPAVTVELGGGLYQEEAYAGRVLDGVVNILRSLGVLPGEVKPAPEQILMHELAILRPHHGGILVPEVRVPDLGGEVPGGSMLGRIYSPYTFELLEEIRAPFDRSLLVLLRDNLAPIHPGAYMYMIGNGATAETLPANGEG
ncbi:MAG: succinylglutamate desuccinylase/aspartoacylase family protein [Thermomicrobiales bacterium]